MGFLVGNDFLPTLGDTIFCWEQKRLWSVYGKGAIQYQIQYIIIIIIITLPNFHVKKRALPFLFSSYIEVLPTLDGYINEIY